MEINKEEYPNLQEGEIQAITLAAKDEKAAKAVLVAVNRWRGFKPFKDHNHIPPIPVLQVDLFHKYLVPEIIRCGGIPKENLIVGATYEGDCRNASKATWDGNRFHYMRTKFGYTYDEKIKHFQDDDGSGYDVFVPIKKIEDGKE